MFIPKDVTRMVDTMVYPVDTVLYKGICTDCGKHLHWEANKAGDDTTYAAVCCEFQYRARPYALKVSVIERGHN